VPSGAGLQVFTLFRGENLRLFGERDEVVIIAQMVRRLLRSFAPAKGVGKVQTQDSTAQIEFKRRFADVGMHYEGIITNLAEITGYACKGEEVERTIESVCCDLSTRTTVQPSDSILCW